MNNIDFNPFTDLKQDLLKIQDDLDLIKSKLGTLDQVNRSLSRYKTTKQVASELGCCETTVRKRISRGEFPGAKKIGRFWYIPIDEILSKRDN